MKSRTRSLSRNPFRTVSIFASFSTAVLNVLCAARVLAYGGSLKWDFDSEADALNVDGVKLMWFLFLIYFAAAATASTIGFVGVARRKLSHVRFFRDWSIVELGLMFISATTMSYLSFGSSSMLQTSVCEELGRQPDLMRDMAESGLNLENCEYWFERVVVAVLGLILVSAVIRVHFIIALSKYYSQLRRDTAYGTVDSCNPASKQEHGLQRIYLLPTPTSTTFPPPDFNDHKSSKGAQSPSAYYHDDPASEEVIVYAPIPLSRLSLEDAKELHATEAWISPVPPPTPRSHKHHRHHSHSHSTAQPGTRHHHKHRACASVSSVPIAPYRDEVEGSATEKV
ncbi:hypothetical protein BDW22DRAFT_1322311 [Trametopsis cervina]|nr:hypothetical protein BDW22DRAFT_1322311 [Trametopsis cervina]